MGLNDYGHNWTGIFKLTVTLIIEIEGFLTQVNRWSGQAVSMDELISQEPPW